MQFYTIDQMSRLLNCGRQTVRNKVASGELEAANWGNHILIIVRHDEEENGRELAA